MSLKYRRTINENDANERRMENDMINEFKVSKVGSEKALYRETMVDSVSICSMVRKSAESLRLGRFVSASSLTVPSRISDTIPTSESVKIG